MTRRWFLIACLVVVPTLAWAFKVMNPLTFARGSDKLTTDALEIIDVVADTMKDHLDIKLIDVIGHASVDDGRTDLARLELSERRAKAVRDRLIARGVSSSRLQVEGMGSTQPVDKGRTSIALARNRRVDFVILSRDNRD